jgi:hypothetical protein
MDDPVERLRDSLALQDEHSYVDAAVREHIGALILSGDHDEDLLLTAQRIVEGLPSGQLAQLVADWLDAQLAL